MRPGHKPQKFAAFIGIDWADEKHDTCLAIPGSEKLERLQLEHAPEALNEWVASLRQRFRGRYVAVAVEQTRGGLVHSLMQHEFMVLYLINPSTSAKFRGAWKPHRLTQPPSGMMSPRSRIWASGVPRMASTSEIVMPGDNRAEAASHRWDTVASGDRQIAKSVRGACAHDETTSTATAMASLFISSRSQRHASPCAACRAMEQAVVRFSFSSQSSKWSPVLLLEYARNYSARGVPLAMVSTRPLADQSRQVTMQPSAEQVAHHQTELP